VNPPQANQVPATGDRPLLTFAVAAFNQERFIREAIEAAFAQTYSPLELVLSDDCSDDRTFEIICEMAKAYRGPHRVVLNRNPVRRSIGGHINRILEISRGELIVAAAGDDVSLPSRAQATYEAWEATGRKATSIHSRIFQIDESGEPMPEIFKEEMPGEKQRLIEQKTQPMHYLQTLQPLIYGCAHAFSRKLFDVFGNLPDEVIHEDNAIGFRSVLAGQLLFINEPLVKYRIHGNNVYIRTQKPRTDLKTLERQEERVRRSYSYREIMYRTFQVDLKTARDRALVGDGEFEEMTKEAARLQERVSLMGKFLESGFVTKCKILSTLWRTGLSRQERYNLLKRLPPRGLLLRLRLARAYATAAFNRSGQAV
jgi:glycosyltransferase involved in cell wall biosynthesis